VRSSFDVIENLSREGREKSGGQCFFLRNFASFARNCFAIIRDVPESARMDEPNGKTPRQKYRWPWFALAAVLLFIALAVLWVGLAAKKVEQQRDFAPLPASAPAR
jgi:hypothetical protein